MKLVIAISAAALATGVLLAPVAQADPARHPHDYLSVLQAEHVSAVPPDLRDHTLVKQLVNTRTIETGTTAGFSWSDAGIGAAATAGIVVILAGMGTLAIRRRSRVAL